MEIYENVCSLLLATLAMVQQALNLLVSNNCALQRGILLKGTVSHQKSSVQPAIKHKCCLVKSQVIAWTSALE